jgi:hypothetical protein
MVRDVGGSARVVTSKLDYETGLALAELETA